MRKKKKSLISFLLSIVIDNKTIKVLSRLVETNVSQISYVIKVLQDHHTGDARQARQANHVDNVI